jgi:S1-C subfamily serine protease
MKRTWLFFSQWVTVLMAAWFVVATLKPEWIRSAQRSADGMTLLQAPASALLSRPAGSLSGPALKASPAVVSINTSKNRSAQNVNPWARFFDAEPEESTGGLGSGVIVSPEGHILTNNHVIEDADDIEVTQSDRHRPGHRFGAAQDPTRQTAGDCYGSASGFTSWRCGVGHW